MGQSDKQAAPVAASPALAPSAPAAEAKPAQRYLLCRGRSTTRGKYRGILETDATTGESVSLYWSQQEIEVVLTESAYKECQSDPEIVVVSIREVTAEEAAAHVRGPVVAGELARAEALSTEALEAEIARRKAAQVIAAKHGRGN